MGKFLGRITLGLCFVMVMSACSDTAPNVDYLYRFPKPNSYKYGSGGSRVDTGSALIGNNLSTADNSYKGSVAIQNGVTQLSTSTDNEFKMELFDPVVQ